MSYPETSALASQDCCVQIIGKVSENDAKTFVKVSWKPGDETRKVKKVVSTPQW